MIASRLTGITGNGRNHQLLLIVMVLEQTCGISF